MLSRVKALVATVAILLFATMAADARPRGVQVSGFNGGRSQIGVNFLQISNDGAFMNAMKGAQSWSYVDNSDAPDAGELDTNGYPIAGANAFSHGGVYTVFYVPLQSERPGNYVATWSGNGTIYVGSSNTLVSGSKTSAAGSGRYVFSTTDYRFLVGIASVGSPAISDLKVFHVDDETEINAGEILGKKFRENWAYMKAGVIRFGDWEPMNTTNVTTWATRKPVNYVFYAGQEYRPSLWAGPTTNVGNAYTATLTPSAWTGLVDKATVIVRFNASATADNSTLNVASTGNIAIRDWYGDATSVGGNTRPVAGVLATLVYDATLNVWIKSGGDTTGRSGLENGVPPEVMLAIATKLGAHPYVTTPYLAADPITDYMPSLATYFRDNGPSWMIPRFEGVNELWNNKQAFYGTRYAWNKSNAYWGISFGQNEWYAKQVSLLGQAISAVYSANRARYQVLAGVQTGTACSNATCTVDSTASSNERLTASKWTTTGTPTQSGYAVSAAYNWVTHVVAANYVNPSRYFTLQALTDGYAYVVTNAGNPSAQAALADSFVNTMAGACVNTITSNLDCVKRGMQFWYGWAQNNWGGSIKLPLTAYEGGYTPDYYSDPWTSPITGATATNPCVLTLATTENARYNVGNGNALTGNAAVAGMQLTISGLGGALGTLLNGNTYTIQSGVSGNSVPINVNCIGSAFTTAGNATYVNAPLYSNTLSWAGKFSSALQTQMTQHYTDMAAIPMVFPAQFNFSGPSVQQDTRLSGGVIGQGQVWGLYDQSVYATPYSPAVESIRSFNN